MQWLKNLGKALRLLIQGQRIIQNKNRSYGHCSNCLPCKECGELPNMTDYGDYKDGYHLQCINPECPDPKFTSFKMGRSTAETRSEWNALNADSIEQIMEITASKSQLRHDKPEGFEGSRGVHKDKGRRRL